MKVLVTGSREIEDSSFVAGTLDEMPFDPDTIIHGDARGVDSTATIWAAKNGLDIESHPVPDWVWDQFGNVAGVKRNSYMIGQADACVAIWDGTSTGTKDAFTKAIGKGIPTWKVVVDVDHEGSVTEVVDQNLVEGDQRPLTDYVEADDD